MPVALLAVAVAAVLSGCGAARQDAHEPNATFPVSVLHASFPAVQTLGSSTRLVLVIRNTGSATIPSTSPTSWPG